MNHSRARIALVSALAAVLTTTAMAADSPPVPVVVTTVRSENFGASLAATGTVVSRNDARISGEVGGTLSWIAEPGATVKRGDTLARISPDRLALTLRDNEAVLKRAAAPQIVPVYGTDVRSTPIFFLQDDHDYFDNDEGTDLIVTFPPPWFQLQLARATQQLYYPEFLADATRPASPGDA